jgi:MoaA/NifB/PqqE/SkfB family radical SAM enzyme
MFDLGEHIRRAIEICDEKMPDSAAWQRARAELLSTQSTERRQKRLLTLCGAEAGQALIGPQMVLADITGRCNASCVFCRDHSPRVTDREPWRNMEMPPELLFRLIDEAEELGCEKMPILAAGEPTLYSRFNEVIERLSQSPMTFEVFTNGLVMKKGALDLLAKAKNGVVYFSVSAATNATFLTQRPGMKGDLLKQIEDNIKALVLARAPGESTPRVILVNVIGSGNFREVIPMMEMAIGLGADEVQYKLTEISDINRDLILRSEQLHCLQLEMRHVKNLAGAEGVDVQDNFDHQLKLLNPQSGDYSEGLFDKIPCRVGYEFVRVRRDGAISFCCGLKFIHNLNEMSLADHWHSSVMRKARRTAVDFPHGANMEIPDGGRLRDEQCDYCYNYILNLHAEQEWNELTGSAVDKTRL